MNRQSLIKNTLIKNITRVKKDYKDFLTLVKNDPRTQSECTFLQLKFHLNRIHLFNCMLEGDYPKFHKYFEEFKELSMEVMQSVLETESLSYIKIKIGKSTSDLTDTKHQQGYLVICDEMKKIYEEFNDIDKDWDAYMGDVAY